MPTVDSEFLTETQVAELLNVPIRTIQTWRLQRRVLPFQKMGRMVRYNRATVEKHLEKTAFAVTTA